LKLQYNENLLIGDMVMYTGDTSFADSVTRSLMDQYLIKGKIYTIRLIRNFATTFGVHYKFVEKDAMFYWYPAKSFESNVVDLIKVRYNLK